MKKNITQRLTVALALASAAILSGCGVNNNVAAYNPYGIGTGACVPISSPIAFQATGINYTSTMLQAGTINGQTVGQLTVGVGSGTMPYATGGGSSSVYFTRTMDFGQLSFTANSGAVAQTQQYPYTQAPTTAGAASMSGTLQLSTSFQSYLNTQAALVMGQTGYYNNTQYPNTQYPNTQYPYTNTASQICVTGMGMSLNVYAAGYYPEQRIVSVPAFVIYFNVNGRAFKYGPVTY